MPSKRFSNASARGWAATTRCRARVSTRAKQWLAAGVKRLSRACGLTVTPRSAATSTRASSGGRGSCSQPTEYEGLHQGSAVEVAAAADPAGFLGRVPGVGGEQGLQSGGQFAKNEHK